MSADPDHTLAELASLAGVPPRTVRYYVAQGLLPSPEGAGPATRYPASALHRLKLVKQLQRQHLPLAEIRRRLASLSDAEAVQLAAMPELEPPDSALEYVRSLLEPSPQPRFSLREVEMVMPAPAADDRSVRATRPAGAPTSGTPISGTPASSVPERSQWERIALEPDVELHVRRPLSRIANKRVDRLVAFARQLLEEETP